MYLYCEARVGLQVLCDVNKIVFKLNIAIHFAMYIFAFPMGIAKNKIK